jgi:hypothetical protein
MLVINKIFATGQLTNVSDQISSKKNVFYYLIIQLVQSAIAQVQSF